ncbi:MAG: helix-turn-helix domain-containing protein [Pseudomonadota bacterium]
MGMFKYWNKALRRRFPTHEAALDRIAELEELRSAPDSTALRVLGLSPRETQIVDFIASRAHVSGERVLIGIWGADGGENPYGNLKVHISKIRRKLAGFSIRIETIHGGELRMDAGSIARWNEAVRGATGGER